MAYARSGSFSHTMSSPAKVSGDRVLHPRSVLVTGANRGIGLEIVKQLVRLPEPPSFIFATSRQPSQAKVKQLPLGAYNDAKKQQYKKCPV